MSTRYFTIEVKKEQYARLFNNIKSFLENLLERKLSNTYVLYLMSKLFVLCVRDEHCKQEILDRLIQEEKGEVVPSNTFK